MNKSIGICSRRTIGILFLIAGVAKFFNVIEDLEATLRVAAAANANTALKTVSMWFFQNERLVAISIGIAMILTGIIQLINRSYVIFASICQIFMLGGFMLFLHRGFSSIIIVDGLFLLGLAIVIKTHWGGEVT